MTDRPELVVVISEAVVATGAASGLLVAIDGSGAHVAASVAAPAVSVGQRVELSGARGYALSSESPAALMPAPTDHSNAGIGGHPGVPRSLLVAPGGAGTLLLEVVDKAGGGAFTFEDLEAASSYATIAEAVLVASTGVTSEVTPPARLGAELAALAEADADRYREVARVVDLLLAGER